mmetsp:Transcript_36559/g.96473  ORF Transcript_36559/g.96473 Transcript_36559/m.96473 type:complete len:327 (-) Transcript_36559:132-1112(-)
MHVFLLLVVLPLAALLTTSADVCRWPRSVLVGSIFVQAVVVLSAIVWKEAPGSIGGHWLPGLALNRGAVAVLAGDGLPVVIRPQFAMLSVLMFGGIIAGEYMTAGIGHFYNWVHMLIYSLGGLLSASSMVASADGRLLRSVIDPACFCALGVLFIGHVHDVRPLPTLNHTYLGQLLIGLALVIFSSALLHGVLPPDAPACRLVRLLTALVYLIAGTWLFQMAIFFYSSPTHSHGGPGDGLYAILEQQGFGAKSPTEAALFFLALTVIVSTMSLTLLVRSHASGGSPSRQPRCALSSNAGIDAEMRPWGGVDVVDEERVPMATSSIQ